MLGMLKQAKCSIILLFSFTCLSCLAGCNGPGWCGTIPKGEGSIILNLPEDEGGHILYLDGYTPEEFDSQEDCMSELEALPDRIEKIAKWVGPTDEEESVENKTPQTLGKEFELLAQKTKANQVRIYGRCVASDGSCLFSWDSRDGSISHGGSRTEKCPND